jgi:hypothetical protein
MWNAGMQFKMEMSSVYFMQDKKASSGSVIFLFHAKWISTCVCYTAYHVAASPIIRIRFQLAGHQSN